MKLKLTVLLPLLLLATPTYADKLDQGQNFSSNQHGFDNAKGGRGNVGAPVVFVTTHGLYYDSIALSDLPMTGDFQQLIPGSAGLETEFGPGDQEHRGGRWWIDINGDSVQNDGDLFFLCPLIGPGREAL